MDGYENLWWFTQSSIITAFALARGVDWPSTIRIQIAMLKLFQTEEGVANILAGVWMEILLDGGAHADFGSIPT